MAETLDIDVHTAQLVPNTKTTVSNQYFDLNAPFAFPRYGNECTPYITGRDYMKAVADAIRSAKSFVMITGWQLDYDVELDKRGDPKHPGRLSEVLADALQRGVHVRVMLYDSVDSLSSIAGSPDTHEEVAQSKLGALPHGKGSIKVMVQNPNSGRSSWSTSNNNTFFSHHQKSVIVDGTVAFVGGIDLAYGRWDTHAFSVVLDRRLHVINDGYNMQIGCARKIVASEEALTAESNGRPGFAPPYGGKLLDERHQPRQPWQDVAVGIRGPAAFDAFVNFVLRWNSFAGSGTNVFDGHMDAGWFNKARGADYLTDPLKRGAGGVSVQICRSASSAQLSDEIRLWGDRYRYINDDWKTPNPSRRKVVQAAREAWRFKHQTSIRDAMVNCIRAAQAFVYIENQFFISACGTDELGSTCPSTNPIITELANAIGRAIYAQRPFHVYLVLPEQPEGRLEDAGTVSQAWWALQGLTRASNSLVNRINATLLAKNMKAWGLRERPKTNHSVRETLAAHGMENKWRDYLTVLNLRNYGNTGSHVVTEMIYVHSKLTIVDDAVAIIGSANINDRSLNGNGDTELAAVMVDDADASMTDVGGGVRCITRKFASDLRKQLWRKHLGMLVDQETTGVQKQAAPAGVNIEKPLDPATIAAIQKLSALNREAYNTVFTHTPRNRFQTIAEGRTNFKLKYRDRNGREQEEQSFNATPALQPAFMTNGTHNLNKALNYLSSTIKGFWVEMPLQWGSKEKATPAAPASPQMIAHDSSRRTSVERSV